MLYCQPDDDDDIARRRNHIDQFRQFRWMIDDKMTNTVLLISAIDSSPGLNGVHEITLC